MPRGDRTGPLGRGPMTGRGAGYCAGYDVPGFMNPVGGRRGFWGWGRGGGRGGGRGWRHWYYATGLPGWMRGGSPGWYGWAGAPPAAEPMTREQEVETLKQHADFLEESLKEVTKRLEELEKGARNKNE